ncbi:MAG TPA: hypothetical protein DDY13_11150 [Cytophagales bacterium]|nr:hypothetical protein [Cytophagales bacterium]
MFTAKLVIINIVIKMKAYNNIKAEIERSKQLIDHSNEIERQNDRLLKCIIFISAPLLIALIYFSIELAVS